MVIFSDFPLKIDDLPMNMVSVMIFRTYLELPQGMSF
jgi:hypothetical protein